MPFPGFVLVLGHSLPFSGQLGRPLVDDAGDLRLLFAEGVRVLVKGLLVAVAVLEVVFDRVVEGRVEPEVIVDDFEPEKESGVRQKLLKLRSEF